MSHIPYYGQESAKSRVEYNKFTDEHYIVIPDDIVEALQLEAGDTLEWELTPSGMLLTKKIKQQPEDYND